MELQIRRIILFTERMEVMTAFYRDVLGLSIVGREGGWVDFAAGACNLALHAGGGKPGKRPPKIAFYAKDVAAARAVLIKRGVAVGEVISTGVFDMCNAKDPDGNPFGLSSRA